MNRPRVSVITPTFGRLRHLRNTIDNLLAQTFTDWEHLICSDGPDDRVKRLVQRVGDSRLKYLHTEKRHDDVGHSPANQALKSARGEVIVRVDDDNEIGPRYLEKMVAGFADDEVGYTVCWIEFRSSIDPKYHTVLKPQHPFKRREVDNLNFMIKADLLKAAGGWQGGDAGNSRDVYAADYFLIDRVSQVSKGHVVPEVLGCHKAAPGSLRRYYARAIRENSKRWLNTIIPVALRRLIHRSPR
jgi:glycosyltransferase involved in cell wall biosynthesis